MPVFTIKEDRFFGGRTPFTIYREGMPLLAVVDDAGANQVREALAASGPTVGACHGASINEQVRLATSLVGTDDMNGVQELRDIIAYLGRLALVGTDLERIRTAVKAHDDGLNDDTKPGGAIAPTGDDYNSIFGFIMDGVPSNQLRSDFAKLKMQLEETQDFLVATFGPAVPADETNPRRWSDDDAFALYFDNAAALSAAERPEQTGAMLAALKTARTLLDEAISTHIYSDDDVQPKDCGYAAGLREVEAAIAIGEGTETEPAPMDFEARSVAGSITLEPISPAARQWCIDAMPDHIAQHDGVYCPRSNEELAEARRLIAAEGFAIREPAGNLAASEPDSPHATAPGAEGKPRFVIVISEGTVTDVVSDDPAVIGTPYATIDHDIEGMGPDDEVVMIPQPDNGLREGSIRDQVVTKAEFPIGPASTYEPAPGYDDEEA